MSKHPAHYTHDDVVDLEVRLLRFAATGAEGSDLAKEAAGILCNQSVRLGQIALALKVIQ